MLIILAAIGVSNAYAYDSYTETEGIMGCKTYMQGRLQNRGWLLGYLTTLDYRAGTTYMQNADTARVYQLFESYCRANPRRNMDEAASAVFRGLRR